MRGVGPEAGEPPGGRAGAGRAPEAGPESAGLWGWPGATRAVCGFDGVLAGRLRSGPVPLLDSPSDRKSTV